MAVAAWPPTAASTTPSWTCSPPSSGRASAVLGVREVEAAAGVPFGALVAVGGNAALVLEHPRQVHQVPGHERGVPVGEVVLRTARTRIEVARSGTRLADPARVGLGRDGVAEVLQRVQD